MTPRRRTIFTATITLLKRVDSLMPHAQSAVMRIVMSIARMFIPIGKPPTRGAPCSEDQFAKTSPPASAPAFACAR